MRTDLFLTCFLTATLLACSGDKDDTGDTDGADTDTDLGADTDTTPAEGGFSVTGAALDVATQGPAAAGLCARLLDPTPALGGGEPLELGATTLDASGGYSFADITTTSTLGLLVEVADCGTLNTTVYTSATGISAASYQDLGEGDTLADVVSFSISMELLDGMQQSAALLGFTGDLEADGMLFGFVVDAATRAPIGGATVTCSTCTATYYMDEDPADGLFSTVSGPNASTVAAGGAAFMIPAAPITSYAATDTNGTYTFASLLIGSNPGSATIGGFYGE